MKKLSLITVLCIILMGPGIRAQDSGWLDYANESYIASLAGDAMLLYHEELKGLHPIEQLGFHYYKALASWTYIADSAGTDTFRYAEDMMQSGKWEGDCEDFAALLAAFCNAMDLEYQYCFGTKNDEEDPETGHAWLEVYICDADDMTKDLHDKLIEAFDDDVRIIVRDDRECWLQMERAQVLETYKVGYTIDRFSVVTFYY